MNRLHTHLLASAAALALLAFASAPAWAGDSAPMPGVFPPPLDSYGDAEVDGVFAVLLHRIQQVPFNLVATLIFIFAIVHTFVASRFMAMSHAREHAHREKIEAGNAREGSRDLRAGVFHFLGEVEVVFGLWLVPLIVAMVLFFDWNTVVRYMEYGVNLTEAAFVVVIMVLAATRPILRLGEQVMMGIARLLGGTLAAFWFTVMTVAPLLGSFITEPAAMTIAALLLSSRFFDLGPSLGFKYATLGLLFVNVSVGGTLTHFAAPPVLMVAGPWDWGTGFMLANFGWKAVLGILLGNAVYFLWFRKDLEAMQNAYALRRLKEDIAREFVPRHLVDEEWSKTNQEIDRIQEFIPPLEARVNAFGRVLRERVEASLLQKVTAEGVEPQLIREAIRERFDEIVLHRKRRFLPLLLAEEERAEFQDPDWDRREDSVPIWVTVVHVLFMVWTIFNAHHPILFSLGLLFFLGFSQVTAQYQNRIYLQGPLLVGFFIAGLVIHGGLQGWWIAPVLGSLGEMQLMLGATVLSAFNDNAAITFLSTLVPGFGDDLKYAVVAGAVAGGGLTVIANAPNPAGQSLLKQHFDHAVAPHRLLLGALLPTVIVWLVFYVL